MPGHLASHPRRHFHARRCCAHVVALRLYVIRRGPIARPTRLAAAATRTTLAAPMSLQNRRRHSLCDALARGWLVTGDRRGRRRGLYVLKFRGAGQGAKALVAELLAGEIARARACRCRSSCWRTSTPTSPAPSPTRKSSTDPGERRAPTSRSIICRVPPHSIRSSIVRSRASRPRSCGSMRLINVDRTARNTNMLMWHRRLWLIDHGAAFYFHHGDGDYAARARDPFTMIKDHVLLPLASTIAEVDDGVGPLITAGDPRESSAWCRTRGSPAIPRRLRKSGVPRTSPISAPCGSAARLRPGGGPCPITVPMTTR